MGTIKDVRCPGCDICPIIAWTGPITSAKETTEHTHHPIDSINFTTKVNCLKDEQAYPGRLSPLNPIARNTQVQVQDVPTEWDSLWNWYHQNFRQEYPPPGFTLPPTFREDQRRAIEEKKLRDADALARIDADAWGLCQRIPGLEPLWQHFVKQVGSDRTPKVARIFLQLIQQLMSLFSIEAARAEVVRSRKEMVDLCERVVKAWDAADDKMDMQDAIEELDSLLYDLDKREGLSDT